MANDEIKQPLFYATSQDRMVCEPCCNVQHWFCWGEKVGCRCLCTEDLALRRRPPLRNRAGKSRKPKPRNRNERLKITEEDRKRQIVLPFDSLQPINKEAGMPVPAQRENVTEVNVDVVSRYRHRSQRGKPTR
jgi:hypothetical protein